MFSTINEDWINIYYNLKPDYKSDLTHKSIRILQYVNMNSNVSINDISKYMKINHNTASINVKRLVSKGLMTKEKSIHDERTTFIKLTDLGKETLISHTALDEKKLHKIFGHLSEDEIRQIKLALSILSKEAIKYYSQP